MRVYSLIPVLAMASFVLGCFSGTTDGPIYYTDGFGGSGGSFGQCDKPKQIRLLDPVTVFNTPVEIRYDSLDRTEPREIGTKMPVTKLEVGDVLHMDPIDPFVEETIVVKGVGTKKDQNGFDVRSLIAVFKAPHIVNAPATTPIEDGCPPFKMPLQDVCDDDDALPDVGASCWKPTCQYGEVVLAQQPIGTPCTFGDNISGWIIGQCYFDGRCTPAPPKP